MIFAIVNNKAANAKGIGMPGNTNVRWKGSVGCRLGGQAGLSSLVSPDMRTLCLF